MEQMMAQIFIQKNILFSFLIVSVLNENQIHIPGSSSDVQKFSKFVEEEK